MNMRVSNVRFCQAILFAELSESIGGTRYQTAAQEIPEVENELRVGLTMMSHRNHQLESRELERNRSGLNSHIACAVGVPRHSDNVLALSRLGVLDVH